MRSAGAMASVGDTDRHAAAVEQSSQAARAVEVEVEVEAGDGLELVGGTAGVAETHARSASPSGTPHRRRATAT